MAIVCIPQVIELLTFLDGMPLRNEIACALPRNGDCQYPGSVIVPSAYPPISPGHGTIP